MSSETGSLMFVGSLHALQRVLITRIDITYLLHFSLLVEIISKIFDNDKENENEHQSVST